MARKKIGSNLSNRHGPRSKSGNGGTTLYVLGAIGALGLLGMGFYWMNATSAEMAVDAETLCPASGPVAETVVLFDVTDALSAAQSNQLSQYLEREFSDAMIGTQFTMGVVSEDPADMGATAPLCKPRSENDVSSLTQNVAMVKQRYQERFLAPINANLQRMISASGADHSPIMESLQALVAGTPGFLTFRGPRKVILVSDLLQHSDAMSFYRGDDWQSFAASPAFQRVGRTLGGVKVEIFGVPRTITKIRDPRAVEDFWLRYFDVQGADLPVLRRLGDL
jgi:hypothetical protein